MQLNYVNRHLILESHSHTGYQPDLRHAIHLTKSEAQILDFLIRQLKKKTKFCKEKDDFLWLKCDQINVAKITDCSIRTVKRAYKKFRDLGFLIMEKIDMWLGRCRYLVRMKWDCLKELLPFSDFKTPRSDAENKVLQHTSLGDILAPDRGHFGTDTPIYNNTDSKEEKEETKMDPLPNDENSSSSSGENISAVRYVVDAWNEMAVRIKVQTVEYDYLDDKTYADALIAYEEFGQSGWKEILTIYEGSRFLRGKNGREGSSPFLFHSVINPKIIGRIRSGTYSGGMEEYNKTCAANATKDAKEPVATMKDLTFEGVFATEMKKLATMMGVPAYKSLIVDSDFKCWFHDKSLAVTLSSRFVFDKLMLNHKQSIAKAFDIKEIIYQGEVTYVL